MQGWEGPVPRLWCCAVWRAGGLASVQVVWPALLPGTKTWWQCVVQDTVNPFGLTLTNAVEGTSP